MRGTLEHFSTWNAGRELAVTQGRDGQAKREQERSVRIETTWNYVVVMMCARAALDLTCVRLGVASFFALVAFFLVFMSASLLGLALTISFSI